MIATPPAKLSQHGVMLIWHDVGLLITGEPGIGKSSLALELLSQNAILIADDIVDITRQTNQLIATCPALSHGILHSRELGLLNIRTLFHESQWQSDAQVDAVVHLSVSNKHPVQWQKEVETQTFLGLELPKLTLTPHSTASLPVRIAIWLRDQFPESYVAPP